MNRSVKILTMAILLSPLACTGKRDIIVPDANGPDVVSAKSSADGIIGITLTFNYAEKTFTPQFSEIPDNTKLSCALEEDILTECFAGIIVPMPETNGVFRFSVLAKEGAQIKAVGEVKFRIGDQAQGVSILESNHQNYHGSLAIELASDLRISGKRFSNGMAIKRHNTTTFKFAFKNTPGCQPKLRCSTDRLGNNFNPLCSGANSMTFSAASMAKGLQFLRVQAECGDRVGMPLTLHWYGVHDNYTYMGIQAITLPTTKEYFFTLMRPTDCPENQLSFECKGSKEGAFKECKNSVKAPADSFSIRAVCNDKPYSAFSLSELKSTL